uniref:tRNA (Uracil-5-)-methyltransferase n=1 Tax=Chromera velia CCMP2878 TaxID=1169474 RepID=A0A0G4HX21_9ALVE|eukprot:Cvel_9187.t1-p1 / transcript=Cvel_9187.t1 / gene=Cvel_9187 / organism=Chromera_velia_CCMP2878 / gene_product=tRNA (uracil(54)-C(5))-methyltransferase, putative / transcript_product=tRNA (uracil(54)-C(5))-methyltransferase, putative / location=Cvel_scaffold523:69045-71141(-) / protein_length=699 / sequence_SO=supercontig / SO=protein_coding / is_pseudo=false
MDSSEHGDGGDRESLTIAALQKAYDEELVTKESKILSMFSPLFCINSSSSSSSSSSACGDASSPCATSRAADAPDTHATSMQIDVFRSPPVHFRHRCRFQLCRDETSGHWGFHTWEKGSRCEVPISLNSPLGCTYASLTINRGMRAVKAYLDECEERRGKDEKAQERVMVENLEACNFLSTLKGDLLLTLIYSSPPCVSHGMGGRLGVNSRESLSQAESPEAQQHVERGEQGDGGGSLHPSPAPSDDSVWLQGANDLSQRLLAALKEDAAVPRGISASAKSEGPSSFSSPVEEREGSKERGTPSVSAIGRARKWLRLAGDSRDFVEEILTFSSVEREREGLEEKGQRGISKDKADSESIDRKESAVGGGDVHSCSAKEKEGDVPSLMSSVCVLYRQAEAAFSNPNAEVNQKALSWIFTQVLSVKRRVETGLLQTHERERQFRILELFCGNGNHTVALAVAFQQSMKSAAAAAPAGGENEAKKPSAGLSTQIVAVEWDKRLVEKAEANLNLNRIVSRPFLAGASTCPPDERGPQGPGEMDDSVIVSVVCDDAHAFCGRLLAAGAKTGVGPEKETEPASDGSTDGSVCPFSLILVDPPRAGLEPRSLSLLSHFDDIIYISCNYPKLLEDLHNKVIPATHRAKLESDCAKSTAGPSVENRLATLKSLSETHCIQRLAIFDQFPGTPWVEVGVHLRRRRQAVL